MNQSVWIVLIVSVTVIVALFIFRRQLSSFFFKASKEGLETRLETRETIAGSAAEAGERASVNISGTRLSGCRNKIKVSRPNVNISKVDVIGRDTEIVVEPEPVPKSPEGSDSPKS